MKPDDTSGARCLVVLGTHEPAIAAVGEAVACREGRWVVAVAPMERHRSPDLAALRGIARRADADPFSAVVEGFGPGRARSIFALVGPPGVIAGSSAAFNPRESASVRCDPPGGAGAVAFSATIDSETGWVAVPGGQALAWGEGGPEVLLDLRTGEAELLPTGVASTRPGDNAARPAARARGATRRTKRRP